MSRGGEREGEESVRSGIVEDERGMEIKLSGCSQASRGHQNCWFGKAHQISTTRPILFECSLRDRKESGLALRNFGDKKLQGRIVRSPEIGRAHV